jgi:predicted PurR-regulated permease PerM
MGGVFTVVMILAAINTLGLYFLNVKFALLLGLVSAICNFVPYFGVWIGAIFPLSMAIFTGESPQQTLGVLILYFLVDLIENNILTPYITGGSVQVNPLMTIIGIISAGMVWGIPGMFVVIPLLGMLKIVLGNNENTKPFAFLIGTDGTAKHTVTMKKIVGFFKRQNNNGKDEPNSDSRDRQANMTNRSHSGE